jgi:maleamate amidohydrolase
MVTSALKESYRGLFDGRLGFGNRPALLVVDFVRAYVTPGSPLYAEAVCAAVDRTVPLVELARSRGVPVVFTRVVYTAGGADGGLFVRKVPLLRELVAGNPMTELAPALVPAADEVVVIKQYASAFFGTALAPMLTASGIDTVIVTGCSTSGCVRATAVDGMQHGFRVVVPRDCVGDRAREPHEANLFDIDSKYGDVVGVAEVEEYLRDRAEATV